MKLGPAHGSAARPCMHGCIDTFTTPECACSSRYQLAGMVVKLWALVTGQCCEDSSDSALHQEVLLPGHLFCKALHERLSVWLAAFAAQVRLRVQGSGFVAGSGYDFGILD